MKLTIYDRCRMNGAILVDTCVSAGAKKVEQYMKGARRADRKKVARIALQAGVISEDEYRYEVKNPYYNPYHHYVTKDCIIYVHSSIEHFIKPL